jgi:hypothetical protein
MKRSNKILLVGFFSLIITLSGCTSKQSPDTSGNIPSPSSNPTAGQVYSRAKAEFDLSSSPSGSAQFNLVKKSYAAAPNCTHGQCTDYTDITVSNSGSTQFELSQSQAQISQNTSNQNLSNIVDLKIATLFDNNLTSCGGQKCTAAAIRIYTTDDSGQVLGAGLWSQAIGKSVPLTVSGGSSNSILAMVPYFSAAGTPDDGFNLQIDLDPLAVDKNVLSLQMADFTQAGAGSYKAHVVVEYDLIGPSGGSVSNPIQYSPLRTDISANSGLASVGQISGGVPPYSISGGSPDYAEGSFISDPFGNPNANGPYVYVDGNSNGSPAQQTTQESFTITDSINQTASFTLSFEPGMFIQNANNPIIGDGSTRVFIGQVVGGVPPYFGSAQSGSGQQGANMIEVDSSGDITVDTNTNNSGFPITQSFIISDSSNLQLTIQETFMPLDTQMSLNQMTFDVSAGSQSMSVSIGQLLGGIPPYQIFDQDGAGGSIIDVDGSSGQVSSQVTVGPYFNGSGMEIYDPFTITDSFGQTMQFTVEFEPNF